MYVFGVFLLCLLGLDVTLGIRCYQCNSALDKRCEKINEYQLKEVEYMLQNCTLPDDVEPKTAEAFCRRIEFTTIGTNHHRVARACGWIKSDKACYNVNTFDLYETVCQCFDDGCNSANTNLIKGSQIVQAGFLIVALLTINKIAAYF